MTYLATGFQDADRDASGSLISCLDAISSHPFFRAVKEESFALLTISPGDRVLEVGCGTGADACRLADLAGNGGRVVGIDPGCSMIREAIQAGVKAGHNGQTRENTLSFLRMDGRSLGFSDEVFDAVREDRALQHIASPDQVVREMIRVLIPGGRFVIFEPDWELFIIDSPDRQVTRIIQNFWTDSFVNGWIGRTLYRVCQDAGACGVTVLPKTLILHDLEDADRIFAIRDTVYHAEAAGILGSDEAARWLSGLQEADCSGRFFCSFTGYLVSGRKG